MKKSIAIVLSLVMLCVCGIHVNAADTSINNGANTQDVTANLNLGGQTVVLDGTLMNEEARKTFDEINRLREEKGVPPLVWANDLDELGKLRAIEIQEIYSHSRPNGEKRIIIKDGKTIVTGENIAMGYGSAEEVMNGWTNSPAHYANMTDIDYQSYYCACFVTYDEVFGWPFYTWVQLFTFDKLDNPSPSQNIVTPSNVEVVYKGDNGSTNKNAADLTAPSTTLNVSGDTPAEGDKEEEYQVVIDTVTVETPVLATEENTVTIIPPVLEEGKEENVVITDLPVLVNEEDVVTTIPPVLEEGKEGKEGKEENVIITDPPVLEEEKKDSVVIIETPKLPESKDTVVIIPPQLPQ